MNWRLAIEATSETLAVFPFFKVVLTMYCAPLGTTTKP